MTERKMLVYTGVKGQNLLELLFHKAALIYMTKDAYENNKITEEEKLRLDQMIDGDEADRFIVESILKQKI